MTVQPEVQETEVQTRIRAFNQRYQNLGYGNGQYWLLCLAAFPIAVTPDMLYRIWNNFRQLFPNEFIDRVAVSDVLLWPAWSETAPNLLELDEDIRNELLTELKQLGEDRKRAIPDSDLMQELAQFLYQYTIQTTTSADNSLLQKAQLLGVQAMLAPGLAARQVETELATHIRAGNEAEILRMRNLVGALAGLHTDFEPLLSVTKGLKAHLLGMPQAVWQRQFVRPNEIAGGQVLGMAIDTNVADGEPYLTVPLLKDMEGQLALPERPEPEKPKQLLLLCVGIDAYEGMPLQGCVNDAQLLFDVLPNYFKADNQEVIRKTLVNEAATRDAILEALAELLNQARSDDMVVFTFSGHGQNARQRAVQNTMAAYGFTSEVHALAMKDPDRMAAYMITETEFNALVHSAGTNNPHVLLISDAHNGSPNWLDPANPKHIILTAGSDWDTVEETRYEEKPHGALTAALVMALRSTRNQAAQTYHSLIRKIYQTMQREDRKQTPQLFGKAEALKRMFLSPKDSLYVYAQELSRYIVSKQELSYEARLAASRSFESLIAAAQNRYQGRKGSYINTKDAEEWRKMTNNKTIKTLELAMTVEIATDGLWAVCIGCEEGLNQLTTHFNPFNEQFRKMQTENAAFISFKSR